MILFNFEVREAFTPSPLGGDIKANSKAEAYTELIEWYAMELGTHESEIKLTLWEVI
ncbi:hypothetical protein [Virgibacillus sp. CBA3643]|uniref:hypothetical protein n=1 Tax=Virgibacillus sp. CBA3643 TaxID=2942278 RepID=UPI0035A35E88